MTTTLKMDLENWVEIGVITSAYGLKGELKVTSLTDFPERFETSGERLIISPDQKDQKIVSFLQGRYVPGKNQVIISFQEITDRTQAENLQGYKILAPHNDLPPLEEDEYHISQLIDLKVYQQSTGTFIGNVINVLFAGNDILEVQTTEKKTLLIPLVKEIVPLLDLENQRIEINPPKGLLDL